MADPRLRQLTIKGNIVKRIAKDRMKYEEELAGLITSQKELEVSGADAHAIKKAVELVDETRMMISDCNQRLTKAVADLELVIQESEGELNESQEFQNAKTIHQEVSAGDN